MSVTSENAAVPLEKLREVANAQRWVILSLLLNIAVTIYLMVFSSRVDQLPDAVGVFFYILVFASVVTAIVSAFLLARQFTNVVFAVFASIAMFVPVISLLVLVYYNQRATTFLRKNGVRVGFFGVNPHSI